MKYTLKRNNKVVTDKTFKSYEEARSFARKLIRQQYKGKKRAKYFELTAKKTDNLLGAIWDNISRNPTNITAVGFRIVAL